MISPRFISNLALAVAGGVVVAVSQAFSAGVTGWVMFGVSLGGLSLIAVVQLDRMRGEVQRGLDAVTGALAVWSAVASVVYNGTSLTWLSLGEALGLVALALVGLVAHEALSEGEMHAYGAVPGDAHRGDREEELRAAA